MTGDEKMTLKENLKKLRTERNLTQAELAKEIFVSRSIVAKWENGIGYPSLDNLKELSKVLGVSEREITGIPTEWEKEVVKIRRKYKRNEIIRNSILGVILLIAVYLILLCPGFGKRKNEELSLKTLDHKNVSLVINKQAGVFTKGKVTITEYPYSDTIDTVTFQNGILPRKYKIVDSYITIDKLLYVSEYVKTYNGYGDFNSIKVSDKNKLYDSRENCNCIIETSTNHLLKGTKTSFIPDSVTEIEPYAFFSCCEDNNRTKYIDHFPDYLVIPSSVKTIKKFAFFTYDEIKRNETTIILSEGIENIEYEAFRGINNLTSFILPKSLKSMSLDFSLGCNRDSIYRDKLVMYYSGTEEEFNSITQLEKSFALHKDENGVTYVDYYFPDVYRYIYFYSSYEPAKKGAYWHYDENHNPVLW